MSEPTIKGAVNKKWTSTESYRDHYDQIFGKKEESNLQCTESCSDKQKELFLQIESSIKRRIKEYADCHKKLEDGEDGEDDCTPNLNCP
jgi:hypothetical protein